MDTSKPGNRALLAELEEAVNGPDEMAGLPAQLQQMLMSQNPGMFGAQLLPGKVSEIKDTLTSAYEREGNEYFAQGEFLKADISYRKALEFATPEKKKEIAQRIVLTMNSRIDASTNWTDKVTEVLNKFQFIKDNKDTLDASDVQLDNTAKDLKALREQAPEILIKELYLNAIYKALDSLKTPSEEESAISSIKTAQSNILGRILGIRDIIRDMTVGGTAVQRTGVYTMALLSVYKIEELLNGEQLAFVAAALTAYALVGILKDRFSAKASVQTIDETVQQREGTEEVAVPRIAGLLPAPSIAGLLPAPATIESGAIIQNAAADTYKAPAVAANYGETGLARAGAVIEVATTKEEFSAAIKAALETAQPVATEDILASVMKAQARMKNEADKKESLAKNADMANALKGEVDRAIQNEEPGEALAKIKELEKLGVVEKSELDIYKTKISELRKLNAEKNKIDAEARSDEDKIRAEADRATSEANENLKKTLTKYYGEGIKAGLAKAFNRASIERGAGEIERDINAVFDRAIVATTGKSVIKLLGASGEIEKLINEQVEAVRQEKAKDEEDARKAIAAAEQKAQEEALALRKEPTVKVMAAAEVATASVVLPSPSPAAMEALKEKAEEIKKAENKLKDEMKAKGQGDGVEYLGEKGDRISAGLKDSSDKMTAAVTTQANKVSAAAASALSGDGVEALGEQGRAMTNRMNSLATDLGVNVSVQASGVSAQSTEDLNASQTRINVASVVAAATTKVPSSDSMASLDAAAQNIKVSSSAASEDMERVLSASQARINAASSAAVAMTRVPMVDSLTPLNVAAANMREGLNAQANEVRTSLDIAANGIKEKVAAAAGLSGTSGNKHAGFASVSTLTTLVGIAGVVAELGGLALANLGMQAQSTAFTGLGLGLVVAAGGMIIIVKVADTLFSFLNARIKAPVALPVATGLDAGLRNLIEPPAAGPLNIAGGNNLSVSSAAIPEAMNSAALNTVLDASPQFAGLKDEGIKRGIRAEFGLAGEGILREGQVVVIKAANEYNIERRAGRIKINGRETDIDKDTTLINIIDMLEPGLKAKIEDRLAEMGAGRNLPYEVSVGVGRDGNVQFSNKAELGINPDTGEINYSDSTRTFANNEVFSGHIGHIGAPKTADEFKRRTMGDKIAMYMKALAAGAHEAVPETIITITGDNSFRSDTLPASLDALKNELMSVMNDPSAPQFIREALAKLTVEEMEKLTGRASDPFIGIVLDTPEFVNSYIIARVNREREAGTLAGEYAIVVDGRAGKGFDMAEMKPSMEMLSGNVPIKIYVIVGENDPAPNIKGVETVTLGKGINSVLEAIEGKQAGIKRGNIAIGLTEQTENVESVKDHMTKEKVKGEDKCSFVIANKAAVGKNNDQNKIPARTMYEILARNATASADVPRVTLLGCSSASIRDLQRALKDLCAWIIIRAVDIGKHFRDFVTQSTATAHSA